MQNVWSLTGSLVCLVSVQALAGCANGTTADVRPSAAAAVATPLAATAPAGDVEASAAFNPRLLRRFAPVRARIESSEHPSTDAQITLGRQLYFEKRLSLNQNVSCQSCHKLEAFGVDGETTSPGGDGQRGARNSPTVYHAAGAFSQFWDGRAKDVEQQALGPILNPIEMGMPSAAAVVTRLKAIPGYVEQFAKAFPNEKSPLSYENVGRAIGAFERGLTTRSRWDDFLEGKQSALSAKEVEGLKVFTNSGCMVCHTGEFLGGNSYQRAGAVEPWPNQEDTGRASVTANAADGMMFKVPTLRNVSKTAPYFHDGSAKTLDQAVRMMGKHQLGVELTDPEIAAIVSWLDSLTGELPAAYIAPPELPPSDALARK
jgi:cytochrome c peroxidase